MFAICSLQPTSWRHSQLTARSLEALAVGGACNLTHSQLVGATNKLLRTTCEGSELLEFIDPVPALVDAQGAPDPRFFQADRLHLNEAGYAVWAAHVRPAVERHRAK